MRFLPARLALLAAFAAALMALPCAPARAEPASFGIFRHLPIGPRAILMQGDIAAGDNDRLIAALAAYPDTQYLVLDSEGGLISESLLLARTIRDHELATFVPRGGECASACALLWLSGSRRHAAGRVGVHRFATPGAPFFTDEAEAQDVVGQIVELLNDLDVPRFVLVPMLRTPNNDVHWFTPPEMARLRLGAPLGFMVARDFAAQIAQYRQTGAGSSRTNAARKAAPPTPDPEPVTDPAAQPATAPSAPADCSAIPDATAQALCRDPYLAGLDADLTAATRAATRAIAAADMPAFLDGQTRWESARTACKGNIACLERAYGERLEVLSGLAGAP